MHTNMLFRLSGMIHASFVAPLLTIIFVRYRYPLFLIIVPFGAIFLWPFLFCTSWYTDNGLFLTSGRDGKLKVWDPNAQLPIEEFTGTGTVRNVNKPLPPGSNGIMYERKNRVLVPCSKLSILLAMLRIRDVYPWSRIPDPIFSIPDPRSRDDKIPNQDPLQRM